MEKNAQTLDRSELFRYSRQMNLSEVGITGQEKIKKARVLIVGVGGLGIPAAQYLTAAGIGTIGLIDDDTIDASNLHRQVLYGEDSIGKKKIDIAYEKLHDLNPHVEFTLHHERLTRTNALSLFKGYDLVIDGSDNFQTRYLVNDACVLSGIPNVYGSVLRFEGQVSVFGTKNGPCYRCLFPFPPAPDAVPNCAEAGVLGALPGIIGSMQAAEALKLILGIGEPLVGRLLIFDSLTMKTKEIAVAKNPECPICGDHPTISELQDYDLFCNGAVLGQKTLTKGKHAISAEEYSVMRSENTPHFLLDIRETFEFEIANIGGTLIPMNELPSRISELPLDMPIVIMCHVGVRSARMGKFLQSAGFNNILNLSGGIDAWSKKIDRSVPTY
jgi:adenylyltransferase/sulfurtransferase